MTKEKIMLRFFNNEKVLWSDSPKKVPVFNKSDIWIMPFCIIFGLLLLLYAAISAILMITGKSILFSLIGITLIIMGVYLIFFRLWYRKKRISRQVYFVTEKRVFAFDTMRDNVIFDIPLTETDLYSDNKSLILSDTNAIGDFIYNLGLDIFFRKFCNETPSFKYIDDVDAVAKIILKNKEIAEEPDDDSIFI